MTKRGTRYGFSIWEMGIYHREVDKFAVLKL